MKTTKQSTLTINNNFIGTYNMYKRTNLTAKLLLIAFSLIPYIMESGFYWLPLNSDHASDTYTTLCVAIMAGFGLTIILNNKLNTYLNRFTLAFIISTYGLFTVLTYILHTTLGFNDGNLNSFSVYLLSFIFAYAVTKKSNN